MKAVAVAIFGSLALTSVAASADYWGAFSADGPSGTFHQSSDRPVFMLSQQFYFDDPLAKRWTVPADTTVDGASIPQFFWSFIGGPFEGDYLDASVIHDYYFVTKTESSDATHLVFYEGMLAKGVPTWKAKAMYWAVSTFNDKWEPKSVVKNKLKCSGKVCTVLPELETESVVTQAIDLSDPEVAALAVSKFNAIIRTLKTTDGAVLDVSSAGEINANVDSIAANANQLRGVFSTKAYRTDPEALGVLSTFKIDTLDAAPKWENGVLPKMSAVPTFDADKSKPVLIDKAYKLGTEDVRGLPKRLDLSPKTFNIPSIAQ